MASAVAVGLSGALWSRVAEACPRGEEPGALPGCPPKRYWGEKRCPCLLRNTESYQDWLGASYVLPLLGPTLVHWANGQVGRGVGAFVGSVAFPLLGAIAGGSVGVLLQSRAVFQWLVPITTIAGYVGWATHDTNSNSTIVRERVLIVQRAPWTPGGALTFQF